MKNIAINDQPVSVQLNIPDGVFTPCADMEIRALSALGMMFHDQDAVKTILAAGDRTIYEIRYYPFVTSSSDMALGTTIIMPGKVGDEYHMTKGHFHERSDQPEVYHCVQGEGFLQMMSMDGEYHAAAWKPGTITHIPPQFAHRVVNTGSLPLVFVAVFHLAAGHIYGPIIERGFKYQIVEKEGRPVQVLNPKWAA